MRRKKIVRGSISNETDIVETGVLVQVTADEHGKTLSLSTGGMLIGIALEDVREMVKAVKF